jgi:hypothetical protein
MRCALYASDQGDSVHASDIRVRLSGQTERCQRETLTRVGAGDFIGRNFWSARERVKRMNLETALDPKLWEAVRTSFQAGNYSAAILDAIHHLSDVVREKSDLEGDGVALVGSALGGTVPRLKVNNLRTESEQNIQRGVEALLRGV